MNKRQATELEMLGRLPPQAIECEEAILGALLIEKTAITRVGDLSTDMFYRKQHEEIFRAIQTLDRSNQPIDMLTVVEQLKKVDKLESIGGMFTVVELSNKVASTSHLEAHVNIVQQKYYARKVTELASQLSSFGFDETRDIDETLSFAETALSALRTSTVSGEGLKHFSEYLSMSQDEYYKRKKAREEGCTYGVSTGICDLNKKTNGWQKGEMIVIAGRPGAGKTAISLHFAKSAAMENTRTAFFTLEMKGVKLTDRIILSEANIPIDDFKQGSLTPEQEIEYEKAIGRIHDLPIYVDDNSNTTISKIRAKIKALKGIGMVVIDYLQLAEGEDKSGNREREVASMARAVKVLAKELDVPIILLSQLSRAVEGRNDKRPQLSDLRESGAIEQDADMVMFLYRPDYYNMTGTDSNGNEIKNLIELIIAKNREGALGTVYVTHNGSLSKIYDYDNRYSGNAPAGKWVEGADTPF